VTDAFERLVLDAPSMELVATPHYLDPAGLDESSAAAAVRFLANQRARVVFFACYAPAARMLFCALHAARMYGDGFVLVTLGWISDGWWAEALGGDAKASARVRAPQHEGLACNLRTRGS
jgi:hypothetical protein